MVESTAARSDEAEAGLVQLRFADEGGQIHDLNAAELADVLQGLVEFTGQMSRAGLFGDGIPPEVRIRPAQEGSFVLEAVLQWVGDNADSLGLGLTAGGGLTKALDVAIRKLRGVEVSDFEYLDNGNVKVNWPDQTVDEVPAGVWKELKGEKRRTKRALRKIMAPLSDEADRLEIRNGSTASDSRAVLETEATVVSTRTDYRAAAAERDEFEENITTFETTAELRSIDFRSGEKWRVKTPEGTRQATIEDEDFLRRLDEGMALHKNDEFAVTVREVATTKNGRKTKDWALVRVVRTKRGGDDAHSARPLGDED